MHLPRKLSQRTRVYDHAGELLFIATRERAEELIAAGKVEAYGNGFRVRGLRVIGPDAAHLAGGHAIHRWELGMSHRRETYFNPRGAWHIDRIPPALDADFRAVLISCSV